MTRRFVLAATLLAAGCGSAPPPPPAAPPPPPANALQADLVGAPKWVLMGCAAYFGEKKNMICGVGGISGMTDPAMARTAAQGRGRTEIARSIQVKVKSMLKDYQSATKGGPGGKLNNETHVEDVAKQITDLSLSGTRLQDTWISNAGTWYVLMVLDTDSFKDSLASAKELDEEVRKAVVDRAQAEFAKLDPATEGTPAKPEAQ